ncbi:hypothetical protein B0I37DRAFT_414344 [Chaetomium sp. MPI-CAGE-AT-0009]|nr:hypothetical protein B0I37DRAFT_414344 [Chaetomium sp. MPI-CAGE-AT-0009]
MATTLRPRPCVELDIHDDHSHKDIPCDTTTSALGELPLNNIQNVRRRTSIESLARRLDNLHINNSDKENISRPVVEAVPRVPSAAANTKDTPCDKSLAEDFESSNPLALASQQLPSTKEQLSRHQEGRRPRGDSHDDAELRQGEKTLYFGCNLVNRGPQSGAAAEGGKSTNVYTLLATRIKAEEEFIIAPATVFDTMEIAAADQLRLGDASMAGRHYERLDVPKSPGLVVEVNEVAPDLDGDRSRPLSRIEDSVEALDKLEEEIEALTRVTRLEPMLSPEAAAPKFKAASAQSTPLKRATSVRAPASARSKTVERSSSVRKPTSSGDSEDATASSARKVARPTSLLPPKPLAKSSRPPTVSTFELPGEAVARRLKEQREQRMSQQISPEQAAALAAAYSPSKPHFKSAKPPTQPTFELPGEAISRKKREAHEAKLRAQEEEMRKRREFKARPIRGSLAPNSLPRETLASLARQKTRGTESSADSGSTTVTPVAKKRQSTLFAASSSSTSATTRPSKPNQSTTTTTTTPTPSSTTATLPTRGRNPDPHHPTGTPPPATTLSRAASTSTASVHSRSSKLSAGEVAAQLKQRGKEVFARDNSYAAEREREKKEREKAAREARERAAERSRELSRLWAEKQRVKREVEERRRRREEGEGVGVEGRG